MCIDLGVDMGAGMGVSIAMHNTSVLVGLIFYLVISHKIQASILMASKGMPYIATE